MKTDKKTATSPSGPAIPEVHVACKNPIPRTAIFLVIVLALLFYRNFHPSNVLFSNDGPLGGIMAEQNSMPSVMNSLWVNLTWLGGEGLSQPPAISSTLRAILSPVLYAKLLCPFSLFIVGLSACFCFRQLKFTPLACVLGGLAAGLNSDFFSTACWGVASQIVGFGAMFVAVGFLAGPSVKRPWVKVILAGLAVGMGIIEAYDIGALFSLVIAVFIVYQALFLNGHMETMEKKLGKGAARLVLVPLFAGIIALPALTGLIGTQVVGVSGMAQDEATKQAQWDQKTQWSFPKAETVQVFIPGIFGYRDDWYMYESDRPGNDQYWGTVGAGPGLPRLSGTGFYAGIPVVMLVIWGIIQSFRGERSPFTMIQRRSIWFWLAVLPISLFLAYGKFAPFYRFFYELPYASTFRNPDKFMHVFTWALLILFGYGAHGFTLMYLKNPRERVGGVIAQFKDWYGRASKFERGWLFGCLGGIAVALLGWMVYSSYSATLKNYVQTVGISADDAAGVVAFSQRSVGILALFLFISTALLTLIFSGQLTNGRTKWGGVLLGALLVADLGCADVPWIMYWDTDYKYREDPTIKLLADKPYEHRVALLPVGASTAQLAMLVNMYNNDWKQHLFLANNIQCADIIQEPRLAMDKEIFMLSIPPTNIFNVLRFWELSNTRYILAPGGNFIKQLDPAGTQFKLIQSFNFIPKRANPSDWPEDWITQPDTNGQLAVLEFKGATPASHVLPRAQLFSTWQGNMDDKTVLQVLGNPQFDPAHAVMVAETLPTPPAATMNQPAGTVEVNPNYKSKRVELDADVKTPAVLLLNERYNPKWQVEVDGKPAKLLRCDFILRGVYLEPGKHTVVFRFESPPTMLYINLAAILLGLGLWGFLIGTRSLDDPPPVEDGAEPEAREKVAAKAK